MFSIVSLINDFIILISLSELWLKEFVSSLLGTVQLVLKKRIFDHNTIQQYETCIKKAHTIKGVRGKTNIVSKKHTYQDMPHGSCSFRYNKEYTPRPQEECSICHFSIYPLFSIKPTSFGVYDMTALFVLNVFPFTNVVYLYVLITFQLKSATFPPGHWHLHQTPIITNVWQLELSLIKYARPMVN